MHHLSPSQRSSKAIGGNECIEGLVTYDKLTGMGSEPWLGLMPSGHLSYAISYMATIHARGRRM